jgi:hypothetical protein
MRPPLGNEPEAQLQREGVLGVRCCHTGVLAGGCPVSIKPGSLRTSPG